jgi:nucleoside 2-deoxyribosyltransferase
MAKRKIYLAGPITGLSFAESDGWRDEFKALVAWCDRLECWSPLRGKDYLRGEEAIADAYEQHPMSTARAILTRDYHDVMTADALVVNLKGATRVSIGTVVEVAWAYQRRIPIILIDEPGSVHDHAFLREMSSWVVNDVKLAASITCAIFNP